MKLLVLHGNISSSVFFLPLLPYLEDRYDVAVPDLRCFGNTDPLPVDAVRGYRDWSDDIYSFVKVLGWKHFFILGWSMGGCIGMQFVVDHGEMTDGLILASTGSPYGFGGTVDEKGSPLSPLGLGSGGGSANPLFTSAALSTRDFMRRVLNRYLFKPPFRMTREWENRFAEAAGSMAQGQGRFPGNWTPAFRWPYFRAGDKGVLNTMSPEYGNLSAFLTAKHQPPVLWIHGDADLIVSDDSMMEVGSLGKRGLLPGWPGEDVYPPQPMMKQIRYFLGQYRENGGNAAELEIPGGHLCLLESPMHFIAALDTFTA